MGRKIAVTVKPNAKKIEIMRLSHDEYRISVREPARDGHANRAVIDLLARHLGVPKSMVKITRGRSSRHKLFEVTD